VLYRSVQIDEKPPKSAKLSLIDPDFVDDQTDELDVDLMAIRFPRIINFSLDFKKIIIYTKYRFQGFESTEGREDKDRIINNKRLLCVLCGLF